MASVLFAVALFTLIILPGSANAQTSNSYCEDFQTLLINSSVLIDDGQGQPEFIVSTRNVICPYGCQTIPNTISNTTFEHGACIPAQTTRYGILVGIAIILFIIFALIKKGN